MFSLKLCCGDCQVYEFGVIFLLDDDCFGNVLVILVLFMDGKMLYIVWIIS